MTHSDSPIIGAYYYPGWHPCPERDKHFPAGWSEWDLVYDSRPRFIGHEQPNIPVWGKEMDCYPDVFERKIQAALTHGVRLFVFAFYWSRGKRIFQDALDLGFLKSPMGNDFQFAFMWANRMPRRVLPVKIPGKCPAEDPIIDPMRLVYTDEADFMSFIRFCAEHYFSRPNYFRLSEGFYISIFDTNFFLRQMGLDGAKKAICAAREWLFKAGCGGLHLAAIDPIPEFQGRLREIGFDSVTHYVFLPEWKGDFLQDYWTTAMARKDQWADYLVSTGLPYFPSLSPGWDASPRGADFGKEKPRRYPWWPVVTGRHPERFGRVLSAALDFSRRRHPEAPLCLITSWNEWSEGHYLEPDNRYGLGWLEAIKKVVYGV